MLPDFAGTHITPMNTRRFALAFVVIAISVISSGCVHIPDSDEVGPDLVAVNSENLRKLEIGSTKASVREMMGIPQKTATFSRFGIELVYWKYQTSGRGLTDWALNDSNYTYLAFEGDILVAKGAGHEVIPFNDKHPLVKRRPQE